VGRCLLLALALAGCTAAGQAVPTAPDHPTDAFPAPPGFVGERTGEGTWEFRGRGTPEQAALYFQVSCVEFLGWRLAADGPTPDGGRALEFTRGAERLRVEVRAAGSTDTLRVLVALARGAPASSTESTAGHVAAEAGTRD